MISLKNLNKKYKDNIALNLFDLEVREQEILGIVGPNGAGKTTLFKIMMGLISKSDGEINILNNYDEIERKEYISYLPEEPKFIEDFTVKEVIKVHSLLYRQQEDEFKKSLNELQEIFQVKDVERKTLRNLSKGTRRRVFFLSSLININKSKILILDEPFDGIDPQIRMNVLNYLKSLKNKTIVFSSHTIADVEKISTKIVLMNKGIKHKEILAPNQGELEKEFVRMVDSE